MTWDFTVNALLYALTGVVALITAWLNWQQRNQPGIASLALSMVFVGVWSFGGVMEVSVVGLPYKQFWLIVENLASSLFLIFMSFFVLEYHHLAHWLTPRRRFGMWALVGIFLLLQATNPWHHWVWVRFYAGPPGSNLMFSDHGPAYVISAGLMLLLALLLLFVLFRQASRVRGWERQRTARIIASLAIPLATYLIYLASAFLTVRLDLMPLGLTAAGLLITSIVFSDLQRQVAGKTDELNRTIHNLTSEIQNRQRLEEELRQVQDLLSIRLAEQSQKLAGLYDIILLSSQSLAMDQLLQQLLEKLQAVLDCDAACFLRLNGPFLQMDSHWGLPEASRRALDRLSARWLPAGHEVRADIDVLEAADLPAGVRDAGFRACLSKWVYAEDRALGVLVAFWQPERTFAVEEIALFGASTDAVGIILENARLRQSAADTAIQQERRRMARELHDSVTQSLHSLVYSAETASQLLKRDANGLERVLDHLASSARLALKEMRLLLFELRLASLDEIVLVDALKNRLDAVERRAGVDASLVVEDGVSWPPEWDRELYPIAIESLNNALKHARASVVEICFKASDGRFEMQISDDGCGFDPQLASGGMGLNNMAERAERIGGRLDVRSWPGKGAHISVIVEADRCE